jgi:membrane fusion protein (multidrug efflux system)
VTAIAVSKGDRISAGAPLMTLSRTDRIILSVGVEAAALDKVKPDMPVHLTSLLPGRKPSEGKVKRVGVAIDPKTRQVPVFIELAEGAALSGENFKAGIEVGKFQGWVVPRDSIGTNSRGTFVYQVDEAHAKRVYVKVVGSVGKNSVVEGDIDSQKELILSGNYQVDDGDAVRPEEAPAEEEEEEE